MSIKTLHLPRPLHLLAMVVLAVTMSACAGRPKPLEPSYPVDVTAVRVTAESSIDAGFAQQLQERLETTLGRGTRDIGRPASLRVIVRSRGDASRAWAVFDDTRREAVVELVLNDDASGRDMRSRAIRASATSREDDRADMLLISRLAADIRGLLGLSGYPPHPVSGAKQDPVSPIFRDDMSGDGRFSDAELRSDPLLNGAVTPTAANLEMGDTARPKIDLSKPLLSSEPAKIPGAAVVEAPQKPQPSAIVEGQRPTAFADDEPCIITLDNDCSDPDNQ